MFCLIISSHEQNEYFQRFTIADSVVGGGHAVEPYHWIIENYGGTKTPTTLENLKKS